eukprot:TRINITY_DN159_c0_g2_i1.p1 TRINITY_DN159_c0_g2~~TRINITY_DN159_c0_g2_i1.p1  ORF type:complete len:169 (-),score=30.15 TRINITY_DN159_c0_g2_i1:1140-1646(-)
MTEKRCWAFFADDSHGYVPTEDCGLELFPSQCTPPCVEPFPTFNQSSCITPQGGPAFSTSTSTPSCFLKKKQESQNLQDQWMKSQVAKCDTELQMLREQTRLIQIMTMELDISMEISKEELVVLNLKRRKLEKELGDCLFMNTFSTKKMKTMHLFSCQSMHSILKCVP